MSLLYYRDNGTLPTEAVSLLQQSLGDTIGCR